jgi:hypothetical protein
MPDCRRDFQFVVLITREINSPGIQRTPPVIYEHTDDLGALLRRFLTFSP